jgi:hypothetical protein
LASKTGRFILRENLVMDCCKVQEISLCIAALPLARKTRVDLMKNIDADYYGYRDEDDGVLIPLEQEHEKEGRDMNQQIKNMWTYWIIT